MADRVAVFNKGTHRTAGGAARAVHAARHRIRRALRRRRQRRRMPRWRQARRRRGPAIRHPRRKHRRAGRIRAAPTGRDVPRRARWSPCSIHGAASRWQVKLDAGEMWSALVTEEDSRALNGLAVGARVRLSWPREAAVPLRRARAVMSMRAASTFFYRRPYWYLALLLVPPLLWFGTVYLGSLFALLCAELLPDRRLHRADRARADARHLPATGHATGQRRHRAAHADHGHRGDDRLRADRAADRHLHGALRARPHEGVLLRRRDVADVDQLPGEGVRLAPAAREGGHHRLGSSASSGSPGCWMPRWRRRESAGRRCRRRTSACSSCSSTCGCRS